MELLDKIKNINFRRRFANRLFYLALIIEIVLMIVEKSELSFSYESYIFRVTFVLTYFSVIIADHNKKEWLLILGIWIFTFICYRITGKNDLLRFATFIMAAKNINLGKTMKATFWIELIGFLTIALMAVTGVLGSVAQAADYGRDNAEELRYVFGFGHPNTLWSSAFVLMLLWIWVYGSKAKLWHYLILLAIIGVLYKFTASRTSLMIGLFMFAMAIAARYIHRPANRKYVYMGGLIITPLLCVAFSVWAAIVSPIPRYSSKNQYEILINRLDEFLNNRIHNLYRSNYRHSGAIDSWKLFSDRLSTEYFDMGWVRLFYWYGIIPAALVCVLVAVFIYLCYKRRDAWTLIIIVSLSIYTVIEATFVSVYVGRNILIPVLGVYLAELSARDLPGNFA